MNLKNTTIRLAPDCFDSLTGEINATQLAENVAHERGHDEWLDDETTDVWTIALDVAKYGCVYCGSIKRHAGPDCANCGNDPAFNVEHDDYLS